MNVCAHVDSSGAAVLGSVKKWDYSKGTPKSNVKQRVALAIKILDARS